MANNKYIVHVQCAILMIIKHQQYYFGLQPAATLHIIISFSHCTNFTGT